MDFSLSHFFLNFFWGAEYLGFCSENWTFCSEKDKKRKKEYLFVVPQGSPDERKMTPPPSSSPTRRVVARLLAALSKKSRAAPFKSSPFFRFGTTSFETHHLDYNVVVAKVLGKHRCLCSTFSTKGTGRTRDVSAVLSTRTDVVGERVSQEADARTMRRATGVLVAGK